MLRNRALSCVVVAFLAGLVGCKGVPGRVVFTEDPFVNVPPGATGTDAQGGPLELAVVCVTSADVAKPENARLNPNALAVTSRDWFAGTVPGATFAVPTSQVHYFTDDPSFPGIRAGAALKGSNRDGMGPSCAPSFPKQYRTNGDSAVIVFANYTNLRGTSVAAQADQPLVLRNSYGQSEAATVHVGAQGLRLGAASR